MRSSRTVYSFKPLLLLHSPQGAHELRSPRRTKTERGCVGEQPQRVGGSKAPGVCGVLRLVEDDTAALRIFGVEGRTDTRAVTLVHELQSFPLVELQLLARRRARIYVLFAEVLP